MHEKTQKRHFQQRRPKTLRNPGQFWGGGGIVSRGRGSHAWQCTLGTALWDDSVSAQDAIWDGGVRTHVGHVQGKRPPGCARAPAPRAEF